MGALTLTVQERGVAGNLRYAVVDAAFSASYATGGDTGLTAAVLGWSELVAGIVASQDDGFTYAYDRTNGTLLAYQIGVADQGAATANNTIVKGASVLEIAGTGLTFQQALAQVTSGTDLSTTPGTVRLFMLGK